MKLTGWFLDAYIWGDKAILWLKTEEGKTVKLVDSYTPDFYVKLRDGTVLEETATTIGEHPQILDACIEWKYLTVTERRKTELIHITVDSAQSFKNVLKDLGQLGNIAEWFNIDILHIQRYFFKKNFAPTQKLKVEFDPDGTLKRVAVLEDDLEIRAPPFTSVIFQIEVQSEKLSPDPEKDSITAISILNDDLSVREVFRGEEKHILETFIETIQEWDPDFLVTSKCDEATFPYLFKRFQRKSLNPQLGRESVDPMNAGRTNSQNFPGRVTLDLGYFCEEGIAGVVEKSRFAMVPPGLASRWAAGRIIDSRQCYEALKRDILIPKIRSYPIYGISAKDLFFMDRGGLILSPVVGFHENIATLDFESMFPNILIKYNIHIPNINVYLNIGCPYFICVMASV